MLGRLAEPAGTGARDCRKGRGGVVDTELRERAFGGGSQVSSAPPGRRGADQRREQQHDPEVGVGVGDVAVASTPSAISSPTPRRRAAGCVNTGPSASAERTMSAYVVSEKSCAGVMLPGLAADTSNRHASWTWYSSIVPAQSRVS